VVQTLFKTALAKVRICELNLCCDWRVITRKGRCGTMTVALYPLIFDPALYARPWGGTQLGQRLGKELTSDQPIGESWEIFWKNQVANGEYRGRTLGDLIKAYPEAITGDAEANEEFPLLVKFLDSQDWLSVQVHPDDALAAQLEGQPRGKTECWYVIEAMPGAKIAYGLASAMTATTLREAIMLDRAKEVMQYVTVQAGDVIFVPAGTLHALGPGLLIYELQQTSDTTYRVYDWERMGLDGKPRELHLDKALACTHFEVQPTAKIAYQMTELAEGVEVAELVRGQYFALDKVKFSEVYQTDTQASAAHLVSAISGHVEWRSKSGSPQVFPQGTTALIPAGIGEYTLMPDGEAEVLIGWATR
jgi:mannose-6-phosphate isomerase